MRGNSKYIIGNSRLIKEIFEENKIEQPNLIVSSPPYFDILNYNNNVDQIGFGQNDYEDYLKDVCNVFQDLYSLSTPNASFWLIIDTFKKDGILKVLPFDIVTMLNSRNEKTWILKEIIIWDKEKNLPWNGHGNFKNQFEYILFFTKNNDFHFSIDEVREINDLKKWWKKYPERYNPNGKAPSNLWSFTTAIRGWGNGKQEHLCPLPFPLIEKILTISSKEDDLVFDPFAGSGSLLALAEIMGRNAVGIDINEDYKKLFEGQIKIGGQEYWDKRKNEINNNKTYLQDFKTTNKLLRVHKVAAHFSEAISLNNPNIGFNPVIICNDLNSSSFDLYLLCENEQIIIPAFSESVNKLLKQAKVTANIQTIKPNDFKSLPNIEKYNYYKYNSSKIYSYNTPISFKTLIKVDNNVWHNVFYSIFSLKLI